MPASHARHDSMYGEIKLFAGTSCPELSHQIASELRVPLCGRDIIEFSNENLFVKLHQSVRGQDCYVIQSTSMPVHRNLMEMLILLQTLRLDSAARVTAVVPYLCYARSDKKDQPRVPITARLVADMIEVAGADRYMTYDLHAGQIQGFFSIPGDVLTTFHLLKKNLIAKRPQMHNPVVVAADLGFAKKGRNFAEAMKAPIAFIEKRRTSNKIDSAHALTVIGNVKNHDVILVDDEINTGESMVEAVSLLCKNNVGKIYMVFTHAVLSSTAVEELTALPVTQFICTNTIPIPPEKCALFGDRLEVISIAPMLSEVILRANEGRSVGEMFNE